MGSKVCGPVISRLSDYPKHWFPVNRTYLTTSNTTANVDYPIFKFEMAHLSEGVCTERILDLTVPQKYPTEPAMFVQGLHNVFQTSN